MRANELDDKTDYINKEKNEEKSNPHVLFFYKLFYILFKLKKIKFYVMNLNSRIYFFHIKMEAKNEFISIYDELKKESLKDQKVELNMAELEKRANLLEEDERKNMKNIKEFLEGNEFVENLNNFILAYNRQNIINSEFYQKNKGLQYFKDFISFRKIKFKFLKDLDKKNQYSNNLISKNLMNNINNEIIDSLDTSFGKINLDGDNKNKSQLKELNKSDNIDLKNKSQNNKNKNVKSKQNKSLNKSDSLSFKGSKGIDNNFEYQLNKSNIIASSDNNLKLEKVEMSNGISYEMNAIDFIKYALAFSFLDNEVCFPDSVNIQFDDELLKKVGAQKSNNHKKAVKFDLAIQNMSKEEMVTFFENLKYNIFQKEKLNLNEKINNNQNFDLLIEVARNYFSQSQDKYSQISTYILLIKILNYLKDINKSDESNKEYVNLNKYLCNKLKISETNEKVFVLISNGSYHLLSQIIKFSNENKFEDIMKTELEKNGNYSFDYNNDTDKILSKLIKDTSISKIFSVTKSNRNIPNLNKFLNILSDLDKSQIKYGIIYFEDDIKMSLENNILSELILHAKYNKTNIGKLYNKYYAKIEKEIEKLDYKNIINIQFKENINKFLNLLLTTEIKIKREFDDYYKLLMESKNMKNISEQICSDMSKYSFFKNNVVKIYLDINHESSIKIMNALNKIFKCDIRLIDLKSDNYKNYLSQIWKKLDDLLCEITNEKSKMNNINNIYFREDGIFSSNNILQVIEYNFKKYFNENYIINKDIDISVLNYDPNSKEDSNFYKKIFSLVEVILNSFKNLFKRKITKTEPIINSLINNCKCKVFYSSVFNQINFLGSSENRNIASVEINNVFKIYV